MADEQKFQQKNLGLKRDRFSWWPSLGPVPAGSDAAAANCCSHKPAHFLNQKVARRPTQESNEKENHSVQLGFEFQACRLQELFVAAIC